jgi:hypothetical protein
MPRIEQQRALMDINFFSSSSAASQHTKPYIIKRDIKSLIKKFLGSSNSAVIIVLENWTGNLLGLITVPRGMNLSGSLISFVCEVHRAQLQNSN